MVFLACGGLKMKTYRRLGSRNYNADYSYIFFINIGNSQKLGFGFKKRQFNV